VTRPNHLPVLGAALAAEPIFHISNFPVTNSLINAWIVSLILIGVALVASRRQSLVPRGIHNFFEAIIVFLQDEMDKVTNDRRKTKLFFPLIATLFIFILLNNWIGLIPGTGTIGFYEMVHGELELVPLLRPATSDLNFTLALALFSLIVVQGVGIYFIGFGNYISKFVNIRGIFRALPKGPTAIGVAVIEFFVGLLEIIGEVARVASLSLRLFGNVFAGEILIGVMLTLASVFVPVPFMFLEILVGVIQASVFALLVLVFLTVATIEHGHEEDTPDHAAAH
jgi:F-type H+-transporting ATPase subunit a